MKNLFNHILPDSALSTFDGDMREENEGSEEEFEELLYFEDLLNQVALILFVLKIVYCLFSK